MLGKILFTTFSLALPILECTGRPLNIATRGYSMGQLHRVDLRGKTNRVIEGELLLGRDSHGATSKGKHRANSHRMDIIDNPWPFCTNNHSFDDIERLVGKYVVIEYKTPRKSDLIKCAAPNELVRIYPVDRNDSCAGVVESKTVSLNVQSTGVNVGRIVSAIESGKHTLSWEIILQEGNSGNQFRTIQIADKGLFDFATRSLRCAEKVKIYTIERFLRSTRTGGRGDYVWKIESLEDI